MKVSIRLTLIPLLMFLLSSPALAQTAEDYHPLLSDKFSLGLGAFWPKIDFDLAVNGSAPEDDIDLDEALNLSDSQTSPAVHFRWRFGEKWSLFGQYWGISNDGKEVLEEDVSWGDVIFREGTHVGGGVGLDVARVFFGRTFDLEPQHEFGIGLGVHWMQLDTYMEGEIFINDDTTEFHRATASAEFPLPNIGAWYMYSWSPKWVLHANLDWLSASIGDYSGGLWDIQAGINYQAFKNIGFGLQYKVFLLDVDVDKSDWRGEANLDQSGPMLSVTAVW